MGHVRSEIILIEAGGRLTDLFGQPLRYNGVRVDNRNGIVATNGAAHEMVIENPRAAAERVWQRTGLIYPQGYASVPGAIATGIAGEQDDERVTQSLSLRY
jgi:hypothetical protein